MEQNRRKAYTHLIWDFNGTVLNDVALGIRSVNMMLSARGLPVIPDEAHYREIFRFPIYDYYRSLGFDFEAEDYYTVLAPEWVANYMAGEPDCPMIPGVAETIARVSRAGIRQVILSATERNQLLIQLGHLGLTGAFDEVMGLDNIHAGSKTSLAVAWAAEHPDAVPLFLGDTEHDAEVAAAVGADVVLFTGGHQSEKRLSRLGKPLIGQISEICGYLGI